MKKYISPVVCVIRIEPLLVVCLSNNDTEGAPNIQYSRPDTFEEMDATFELLEWGIEKKVLYYFIT